MVNTTSQSRHIHTSAHALCSQAVTAVKDLRIPALVGPLDDRRVAESDRRV